MRFQLACDRGARSAAGHRLTRALNRGRTAAVGALAVAACGLAVAACGGQDPPGAASSPATSPSSPSAPRTSACRAAQLKIRLTYTGAVGGQAGGYLQFTNDSRASCRLSGWPAVTGLTAAAAATPLRHAQSTMFGAWRYVAPPLVVTVQPGDSAYAVVAADDEPAGSSTRCPAPYVRLRVSPPGDSGSVTISAWLPGARSYLPSCPAANGSPAAETSTMTTLSHLAP